MLMLAGYMEASSALAVEMSLGVQRLPACRVICWHAWSKVGTLDPHTSEEDRHGCIVNWYIVATADDFAAADAAT